MFDIIYLPPFIQFISNLWILLVVLLNNKTIVDSKLYSRIARISVVNLILFCTALFYTFYFNNSYPTYHFGLPLLYILTLDILRVKELNRLLFYSALFFAASIFIFESIYYSGLFQNNELFTIYFNLSISCISAFVIFKKSKVSNKFLGSAYFFTASIFFITASSRILLSILETQFRLANNSSTFFITVVYNGLDIMQNIMFSILILKWKEN